MRIKKIQEEFKRQENCLKQFTVIRMTDGFTQQFVDTIEGSEWSYDIVRINTVRKCHLNWNAEYNFIGKPDIQKFHENKCIFKFTDVCTAFEKRAISQIKFITPPLQSNCTGSMYFSTDYTCKFKLNPDF